MAASYAFLTLSVWSLLDFVRASFDSKANLYFIWLLVFTGIVAVGVLLEFTEWIDESSWLNRLESRTGNVHHTLRKWIHRLERIGTTLVLIGVSGELVFESMYTSTEGRLAP